MADSLRATLEELVQRADLDGLVRHVDDTCSAREWSHLVRVRDSARAAVDTGRQLWPIATLANYRLALWAPAELAVRALDDTARTFMPGPVSEIIAVHHRWEDLEPFLAPGHDRSLVAHERALRGDDIDAGEHSALDIPMAAQAWEPRYEPASYTDDGVDAQMPDVPRADETVVAIPGEPVDDPETVTAFRVLMEPWTSQSNGSARCTIAEGGIPEVLHAHGIVSARIARIDPHEALDLLAAAPDQIDFYVELTFHPLNTYIGVPAYDVRLLRSAAGAAAIDPRTLERFPRYGARVEGLPLPYPARATPVPPRTPMRV